MSYRSELEKIESLFRKTYLIEDVGVIKLLCAAVIANRMPADPFWMFIAGPSGAGKTELITSLNKVVDIKALSTVTSKTFISGKKAKDGGESSLLHQIRNGILTFKDWTTMLSLPHEERQAIMSQFREIYDGTLTRSYGTGETIQWNGKLGLIAGVTSVIHMARELYAAMGERFVIYSMILPDRIEIARRSMGNIMTIKDQRAEIQDAMHYYLDTIIGYPTTIPKIDERMKEELLFLAEFSTRARSPVEREWKSPQKDITFVHPPEVPTRFSAQLMILASALQVLNEGPLLDIDRHIIFKIALDSISDTRRLAIRNLTKYEEVESSGLAARLNYPTNTTRRWLEDLNALEVVERIKTKGTADRWRMVEKYRVLVAKYENLKTEGRELTLETADPVTEEDVEAAILAKIEADATSAQSTLLSVERDAFSDHS